MLNKLIKLFPVWAILFAGIAFIYPQLFVGIKSYIVPLLMLIMLSMGLTLTLQDFKNVINKKSAIGVGMLLQFTIMPITAFLVCYMLQLDTELTVGMILVGSVAGGTSSNVMCYLAKGDVALSITMTALSTLVGVVLTPVISGLLVGQSVDFPMLPIFISLLKIVVLPIAIGILINSFLNKQVQAISSLLPLISMISIVIIIAIVVALNAGKLTDIGPIVMLAVIIHNSIGLFSGYGITKLLGFDEKTSRTIAFEVGLQNSGLAAVLAMKFFSPAAAIPGTVFSLWHNISGSILSGYWAQKGLETEDKIAAAPVTES